MDEIAAALGDHARWRIVELLTERPMPVGELAELTGLRQPQTTKHLQTLARAGLVTVFPLGQRRVYAIEPGPLRDLANRLGALLERTAAHQGERDELVRYRAAIDAEAAAANQPGWADGRTFSFDRMLAATPDVAWRHWTAPKLMATWWAPPSMTVTTCVIEPKKGGRVVLDYRDADGQRYRSKGRVRAATKPRQLVFDLSVLGPRGAILFTGHYDLALEATKNGTRLRLGLRIAHDELPPAAETTIAYLAGIESGWRQVLDNLSTAVNSTARKES